MNKILQIIDKLISKIPSHLRDLIKKISIAVFALVTLIAVVVAINEGIHDAKPSGASLIKETNDVFYLQKLKEENSKKIKLLEDVEVDVDEFASRRNQVNETKMRYQDNSALDYYKEDPNLLEKSDSLRNDSSDAILLDDDSDLPKDYPGKNDKMESKKLDFDKSESTKPEDTNTNDKKVLKKEPLPEPNQSNIEKKTNERKKSNLEFLE